MQIAGGAVLLYWLSLWNELRIDWATNSQYGFGWAVPPIAVFFFYQKWLEKPPSEPLSKAARAPLVAALVALALGQFPLRWLEEANPEWRTLYWGRELQCVALTLGILALAGGARWARHFRFPVLFTATAVPWSKTLEVPITQMARQLSTKGTVEELFWLGIPAFHTGNLIHLAHGVLGVGDACSGIRSLQSSIMLALVGGEIWKLPISRRWLLVALGCVSAVVLNLGRTLALAVIAAYSGFPVMERWHDRLGFVETAAVIATVFALTFALRPRGAPRAGATMEGASSGSPTMAPDTRTLLSRFAFFAAGLWLVAEVSTAAWYGFHERPVAARWTILPPQTGSKLGDLEFHEIPEEERAQLRTNDGLSFQWREPGGLKWSLSFLRWPVGRSSEACVTAHRPDLCLPAAGYEFLREDAPADIVVNGVPMLFHHYRFQLNNRAVEVFYMVSDLQSAGVEALASDLSVRGRVAAAIAGRRNTRRAVLELLATDTPSSGDLIPELTSALEKVVVPIPAAQSKASAL